MISELVESISNVVFQRAPLKHTAKYLFMSVLSSHIEEGNLQQQPLENSDENMNVSAPIFSLGIPLGLKKYLVLLLYVGAIMNLLAIAELNPWGNDLNNPVGIDEDNGYTSYIDVPWADLKSIHHDTVEIEKDIISTEQGSYDYCEREQPSNVWIKANTSSGQEVEIFVPKDSDLRLPMDSPNCGEEITQAEVYVEKNDNGSFDLLSWAVYGGDPKDKANFEHLRWTFLGIISVYLLLKLQPTELQNRIEKIRRKHTHYRKTTADDWVIFDSWDLVKNRDQEGELISEHPAKLPKTESGVITPWIFLVGIMLLLVHILFRELFIFGGAAFNPFLNHDLDSDIIALMVGAFVITVGPYVLIGKLIHLRSNIANTFGIIFKKRRFVKLIGDVPTSTIRGMPVGRVEIAGVALSLPKAKLKEKYPNYQLVHRVDESLAGIQNPDQWPIFRYISGVKKEDINPNHELSIIVHDGTGSVEVRMPRKNYLLGALRGKESKIIHSRKHWAIDEGDPVLVVGEAMIGKNGQIYIGIGEDTKVPSAVFKGTEWTVQGGFRSTVEYVLADILFTTVLIIFVLQYGGVL